MLFSEPKIPQFGALFSKIGVGIGFSALQRAENSSMRRCCCWRRASNEFQCSSASRKFLNTDATYPRDERGQRFSALQRAENSSIAADDRCCWFRLPFQCSSASRKFLNRSGRVARRGAHLFQCSSASRKFLNASQETLHRPDRRFQCSSASRKFLNTSRSPARAHRPACFSALQRAENSSMRVDSHALNGNG